MRQLSPRRTAVVSAVASIYVAAFAGVAAVLLFEFATGSGAIGQDHLSRTGESGVVELSVVLLFAAALLAKGVLRLRQHRKPGFIAWPLGVFAVFGVIGEIADLAGNASGASNAIGAGIIVLAAIPVGLIVWKP